MTSVTVVYGCLVLIATGNIATEGIAGTLGPICLHCTDISGPTHCDTVTQCGAHEQCFLDTFVNSMGGIVYRQGCRDNRQCQLEPFDGKRAISGELLVCSHCCSGNVCNNAGCGHTGYPSPHGPVCFTCQDQLKIGSCNKITLCGVDEVCNLYLTTNSVIRDKSYETKCMRRQECEADLANFQKIISPGKQDVVDSLSSGGICLFQCCSSDVCNNGCSNNSQSISTSTTPVSTMPTSSAFVTSQIIDHCLSNPCRRGTCSELGYTYRCTCEQGFYGRDCENDAIHVAHTEVSSTPGTIKVSIIATPTSITPSKPSKTPAAVQNFTSATTHQPYTSNSSKYINIIQDTQPTVSTMTFTSATTIPKVTSTFTSTTVTTTTLSQCFSNPCIHGYCHDTKDSFVCVCDQGYNGTYCNITIPSDCYDILHMGKGKLSGIYNVTLWKSRRIIQVYCDMDTDGGGWTVLQSRFDGSVDFYQNFTQYEQGFGYLYSEFWLGLAFAQEMVSQGQTELRLDLTAADNSTAYEVFKNFRLGEKPYYTLHIEPGEGTTDNVHGLGLFYHNNRPFSTYDRDNSHRCAVIDHGGWWYNYCAFANLNGEYTTPGTNSSYHDGEGGMIYANFQNMFSLKSSQMKFRRF